MENVMGLINLHVNEELIKEITQHRPLAAVPFGGRYRLIDFVLSSMVNSGIESVGILLHNKCRSILDHLRSGKEWDLSRKNDGLFILPQPHYLGAAHSGGDIEHFWTNLDYIENCRQKYVVLTGGNIVCNLNYQKAMRFHEESGADITVLYKKVDAEKEEYVGPARLQLEEDGRVSAVDFVPGSVISSNVSVDMYILSRELLVERIKLCRARGGSELVRDSLLQDVQGCKVYGYQYKGYAARIQSIQNYYKHNLELLRPEKWQELFAKAGLVHTKVKDEPPAKYKESAKVYNSMIANGCVIEGRVENSVLFRGVKVGKGAYIKDSIVMQKCDIEDNAILESVICDKDVVVSPGKRLKGEKNHPLVIAKGAEI